MSKPTALSHIVLRTPDVERLGEWYARALDAHPTVDQRPMMLFMSYDEEHHRIGFMRSQGDGGTGTPATGMAHMAFTYASARALLDKYRELKAAGVAPVYTIHHGPTLSAYYRDPDGNVVEMFADVYRNAADADAFMRTPQFAANPVGKPVDIEALLARAEHGATEAELLAYPAGDFDPMAVGKVLNEALEGRS
jgi:catechol-2,3-dioxygenase